MCPPTFDALGATRSPIATARATYIARGAAP